MGMAAFFLIFWVTVPDEKPVEIVSQRARTAVSRGVSFFQAKIVDWNSTRDCVSCHNALPALWGLNQVRATGFPVDEDAGSSGDPIATGQALYALNSAIPPDTIIRAQAYLAGSQREAGAWVSPTDIDGWKNEHTDHSTYWSTA